MDLLIIAAAAVVVALVIGAAVRAFKSPASGSPEEPTPPGRESTTGTEGEQPNIPSYPGEDRPAGPGAEAMGTPEAGSPAPGDAGEPGETPDAVPPSEAGRRDLSDD